MNVAAPKELIFDFNVAFKPVFFSKARYKHIWGGRARGGSHFATDYFLYRITQPQYFRGCFMRSIFGDIDGSLFQDFKDRLEFQFDQPDCMIRETDFVINETKKTIYYKPTGNSIISKGFKKSSGKQSAKLKSLAGITHVIIEEAEEVESDDFNKLDDSIRTNKIEDIEVIMLFNPPGKNHWIIKRWYNLQPAIDANGKIVEQWYQASPKSDPDLLSIHTTYLDNLANINSKTISKYQNYGDPTSPTYDIDFFYRDVKGYISEGAKGRIYKHCKPISRKEYDLLPYEEFFGLDFGFDPHPAAVVGIKRHNNTIWTRQIVYETELSNQQMAEKLKAAGIKYQPIYADSAEEKSIVELETERLNMFRAVKGPDSVDFGIKKLQKMTWYITEDSTDFWFENQEYKFQLNPEGESTGVPIKKFDHLKDATRYGVVSHEIYGGDTRSTGRRN